MQTYSFNPLLNLFGENKRRLVVTSFEATNSVFNKTGKNNSFSFSTPSYWISGNSEALINKLNNLLELRSQNDVKLHARELIKRVLE